MNVINSKKFSRKDGVLSAKTRRALFIIAFMAWPVLHWLIFYVGLNTTSVVMAFKVTDVKGVEHWSFDNFTRIISEGFGGAQPLLAEAVKNTFTFFFFGLTVMTVVNWVISYFFYKKILGYKIFRFVFYLPAILPGIALQTVFKYVISPDSNGVLASIFGEMGWRFPDLLGSSEYAMKTMLVYQFITGWTGFIITVGVLRRIPMDIIEAAQLDGVTPLIEWCQIIFPMLWPMTAVSLVMSVLGIFQASGPVLVFTQGKYGTYTISYWMFENVYNNANMNYTAAAGIFFTALSFPLLFIPNMYEYFDMQDLAVLIAPRKVIFVNGGEDSIFTIEGAKKAFETVQAVYEKAGVPENCKLVVTPNGHYWRDDIVWSEVQKNF